MDFAVIFLVLLLLTWSIKLLDKWVLKPRRIAKYGAQDADLYRSKIVEYSISFFPVILIVFVLRSFVVEPFRIPSSSMLPTLEDGDKILVNKFSYGIRLPIINQKIIPFGSPQRGDVIVFRYPVNPDLDYIKRVVGLPGDTVRYEGKRLSINGQLVALTEQGPYVNPSQQAGAPLRFSEQLGEQKHDILLLPFNTLLQPDIKFPNFESCRYFDQSAVECTVPQNYYFVMGDNRDNSKDSRYWGFVPEQNIVGKAFFIWMNFSELSRIGIFK